MSLRLWSRVLLVLVPAVLGTALSVLPAQASTSSISGVAFQDDDRDSVRDANEAPFSGQQYYLFRSDYSYVGTTSTDSNGAYRFDGLSDGNYIVEPATIAWNAIRYDWVPTTGDVRPSRAVSLQGAATQNFAWRRIVKSTDANAPISTVRGPSGLTVKSYNDAVTAQQVHDALAVGPLGAESSTIEVRFALGSGNATSTGVAGDPTIGYSNFQAVSYVDYPSWLMHGDAVATHEFGHAWTQYYAFMAQRDPDLRGYLEARGIANDSRVGSNYYWNPGEMIAEDYRQLFGSANAQAMMQDNRDLPPASAVPGLRDYLLGAFRTPVAAPEPDPDPAPAPAPSEPVAVSGVQVNPTTVTNSGLVGYSISVGSDVVVKVVDKRGVLIKVLADAPQSDGAHSLTWDRTDSRGRRVKAGTYRVEVVARDSAGRIATGAASFKVA